MNCNKEITIKINENQKIRIYNMIEHYKINEIENKLNDKELKELKELHLKVINDILKKFE